MATGEGVDLGDRLGAPQYWDTPAMRNYSRFIGNTIAGRGQSSYRGMLAEQTDAIGRQQQSFNDQARGSFRANLGISNPGSLLTLASLRSGMALPYGRARIEASKARRSEMYSAGNAFTQSKLAQGKLWTDTFNANTAMIAAENGAAEMPQPAEDDWLAGLLGAL